MFINGKSEYEYNEGHFRDVIRITNPEMLILVKDGKYFVKENPDLKFDAIDFTKYYTCLKTMKNNRYGILGVISPKYKSIEKFNYYLAEAETLDGETVIIDLDGNEYRFAKAD